MKHDRDNEDVIFEAREVEQDMKDAQREYAREAGPLRRPDVRVRNEGSLMLFEPLTQAGRDWIAQHTDGQMFGRALVVEPRYAPDLAYDMIDDGLEVV